jgi:AI-2 transport protein TqsA
MSARVGDSEVQQTRLPGASPLGDHAGGGEVGTSRALAVVLGLAGAVLVAAGMRAANDIVAQVMLAVVLTVAVAPLRRWAMRRRWRSWAATGLMLLSAYAIVLALLLCLAAATVQLAATLPDYADRADELVGNARRALTDLGLAEGPTGDAAGQLDLGRLVDVLGSALAGILGLLGSVFFLGTLLFFLTAEASGMPARVTLLAREKPGLMGALEGFVGSTQRYLLMSALFGAIVAVLDTVALWLLGVPMALTWGFLAFVTNFIPNIGFVIGLVPPALLALLDGGWSEALAVVAVYCVLNVSIQTFIQPRYVGDAVGLAPTVTFLSVTVWTFVLGPLGALLAVPMTLLARAILVDADPRSRWALAFLGSNETTQSALRG